MFLTPEQLYQLTHRRQHRKQAQACAEMGVPFHVRPDGSVAVAAGLFDFAKQPATMSPGSPKMRVAGHGKKARKS
jgi:hypothetical protein